MFLRSQVGVAPSSPERSDQSSPLNRMAFGEPLCGDRRSACWVETHLDPFGVRMRSGETVFPT